MADAATGQGNGTRRRAIERLLAEARQRLIETGTRNRLIHAQRFAKRGKAVDIIDERSDDTFRILMRARKIMRFAPDPRAVDAASDAEPTLTSLRSEESLDPGRFTDQVLQTRFSADKLHKKLLGMAREAKTLEEEQGINALYIALGFLRWYEEDSSETVREAPLVLLPVSLVRNKRTSLYELVVRDEDIVTNEPLKRRLQEDAGLRLPDIPEDEDWLPSDYFAAVADAVTAKPRWSIDANGIQLGFFSFAKLLMVKDLEPESWRDAAILDHPMLGGLLQDGFDAVDDDLPEGSRLDDLFAPSDLVQIVDADASQTLVVEAVRRGRNLVVQGPPGTGKSQTITNIIAAAAHDGKRVLFVAEKMAALNVVHHRLRKAGVQEICLELHSRSANKKAVAEELGRTIDMAAGQPPDDEGESLRALRDQLNRFAGVMHQPIVGSDFTAFEVLSVLIRGQELGQPLPELEINGATAWTRETRALAAKSAGALASQVEKVGPRAVHPFYGVGNVDLLPADLQRLEGQLDALRKAVDGATSRSIPVGRYIQSETAPGSKASVAVANVLRHIATLPDQATAFAAALAAAGGTGSVRPLLAAGTTLAEKTKAARGLFREGATQQHLAEIEEGLAAGESFFGRLGSAYRSASSELAALLTGPLPKTWTDRLTLCRQLRALQDARARFAKDEGRGAELFGRNWRGEGSDFEAMAAATDWVERLLSLAVELNAEMAVRLREQGGPDQLEQLGRHIEADAQEVLSLARKVVDTLGVDMPMVFGTSLLEDVPFEAIGGKADVWRSEIDRHAEWVQLEVAYASLRSLVGGPLADAVAGGAFSSDLAEAAVFQIHAEALYRRFYAANASAVRVTSAEKEDTAARFRAGEAARRKTTASLIRSRHLQSIPRGGVGAMGLVRAEAGKKRGYKPIRRLMTEAGPVIQQIKPVFLMSPISVAQFLPPGAVSFDLLVIDEASQVRPEDALGAVARAKQIVVVGDSRQLPPTSFFDSVISNVADDDDADDDGPTDQAPKVTSATELESVLTLCRARGLPGKMLRWHYRSRHPSLIDVSNDEFYEGKLVLFPSPSATRETDGLVVRQVNGAYDRGGKRNNPIEAEAVARAVAEHAHRAPDRSLGVVTFSTAQRDQVTYWLDKLRQDDPELDDFMREGRAEEVFVKNIENVQGDERDVILISVGYGPKIVGTRLDSMAFGPVSSDGGERRLNVLFTRARYRTEVFVSFASGDIDLSRSKGEGARVLKRFLFSGEAGSLSEARPLSADPDSDFEVAVANVIRGMGYSVDYQVGSAGYRIDLAVRHPGDLDRYMLAIECDGATYHSALWARERDRLRQEVLEGLGWRFLRIWSTDWYHRRSDEVRRLESALREAASATPPARPEVSGTEPDQEPPEEVADRVETQPAQSKLPAYVVSDFAVTLAVEPHEASPRQLAPVLRRIIEIEGPIHQDEITRRLAGLFGKQRAGARIVTVVSSALSYAASLDHDLVEQGGFWATTGQLQQVPLRDRSTAPPSLLKASMLPPVEIEAAIRTVLTDNGLLSAGEMPSAVARLLGFQRAGSEIRSVVEAAVSGLLADGRVTEGSGGLRLAG